MQKLKVMSAMFAGTMYPVSHGTMSELSAGRVSAMSAGTMSALSSLFQLQNVEKLIV